VLETLHGIWLCGLLSFSEDSRFLIGFENFGDFFGDLIDNFHDAIASVELSIDRMVGLRERGRWRFARRDLLVRSGAALANTSNRTRQNPRGSAEPTAGRRMLGPGGQAGGLGCRSGTLAPGCGEFDCRTAAPKGEQIGASANQTAAGRPQGGTKSNEGGMTAAGGLKGVARRNQPGAGEFNIPERSGVSLLAKRRGALRAGLRDYPVRRA